MIKQFKREKKTRGKFEINEHSLEEASFISSAFLLRPPNHLVTPSSLEPRHSERRAARLKLIIGYMCEMNILTTETKDDFRQSLLWFKGIRMHFSHIVSVLPVLSGLTCSQSSRRKRKDWEKRSQRSFMPWLYWHNHPSPSQPLALIIAAPISSAHSKVILPVTIQFSLCLFCWLKR